PSGDGVDGRVRGEACWVGGADGIEREAVPRAAEPRSAQADGDGGAADQERSGCEAGGRVIEREQGGGLACAPSGHRRPGASVPPLEKGEDTAGVGEVA